MIKVNWKDRNIIDRNVRGAGISEKTQLTIMVKTTDGYSSIKSPYSELWPLLFRLEESKEQIEGIYVYYNKIPLFKVLRDDFVKNRVPNSVNEKNLTGFREMSAEEREVWIEILNIQIQNYINE